MIATDAAAPAIEAAPKLGGPKTAEGRRRSSRNSTKHGLSGAGKVLSEADAQKIEALRQSFRADMKPQSPSGEHFIAEMASLSYRVGLATEYHLAAVARNVRNAAEDFDEQRQDDAQALFDGLAENPRANLRKLRRTPEGVEILFETWSGLKRDLLIEPQAEWTQEHLDLAANLIGLKAKGAKGSRFGSLSRVFWGDFAAIQEVGESVLSDEFRRDWAKRALIDLIDGELADLSKHYETLDFETIELDRAEAGKRALVDLSKAGQLARRYEGELRRGFYQALNEFRRVEEEAATQARAEDGAKYDHLEPPLVKLPPPAAPPSPTKPSSFREVTPPVAPEPSKAHPAPSAVANRPSNPPAKPVPTAGCDGRMNK